MTTIAYMKVISTCCHVLPMLVDHIQNADYCKYTQRQSILEEGSLKRNTSKWLYLLWNVFIACKVFSPFKTFWYLTIVYMHSYSDWPTEPCRGLLALKAFKAGRVHGVMSSWSWLVGSQAPHDVCQTDSYISDTCFTDIRQILYILNNLVQHSGPSLVKFKIFK